MGDTEVGDTPASHSIPEPQQSETTKDETKAEEEDSKPKASPSALTLDEVYTKIVTLKTEDHTPDIALEIASVVQCAPYLVPQEDKKNEIMALAKAYQSASAAYSSALKEFSSASEEDKITAESLMNFLKGNTEPSKTLQEAIAKETAKDTALLASLLEKKNAFDAQKNALDAMKDALVAKKDAFLQLHGFQSEIEFMRGSFRDVEITLQQCGALGKAVGLFRCHPLRLPSHQYLQERNRCLEEIQGPPRQWECPNRLDCVPSNISTIAEQLLVAQETLVRPQDEQAYRT
jgi:hypothetical protein